MNTDIALSEDAQSHNQLMAELGFGSTVKDAGNSEDFISLPRLKIINEPIKGEVEGKGKSKKPTVVELVSAGAFALRVDKDTTVYSDTIKFRTFAQQFMIKRYDNNMVRKGSDGSTYEGGFIHTVMSQDQWANELMDDSGSINAGKPSGWIEDFSSLPEHTKNLIRDCKRLRVLFGVVTLVDPVDENGEELSDEGSTPCVWEVTKSSFKIMGEPFKVMEKSRRLPLQHNITVTCHEEVSGSVHYYVTDPEVDLSETIPITDEDQELVGVFMKYINEHNIRVITKHKESMSSGTEQATTAGPEQSDEDKNLVQEFIDIESDT